MSNIEKKLEEFKKSKEVFNTYSKYTIFGQKVLIRLFYTIDSDSFARGENGALIDLDGKPLRNESLEKVYPIAKVIKVGSETTRGLKEGDLVIINDSLFLPRLNPEHFEWSKLDNERPRPEKLGEAPPKWQLGLNTWKSMIFKHDKFSEGYSIDDKYTFLVTENLIEGKYD
jgi:hypothetical protein